MTFDPVSFILGWMGGGAFMFACVMAWVWHETRKLRRVSQPKAKRDCVCAVCGRNVAHFPAHSYEDGSYVCIDCYH